MFMVILKGEIMKRSTVFEQGSGNSLRDPSDESRNLGHFAAMSNGLDSLLNSARTSIKMVGKKAVKKVIPGDWGLGG